MPNPYASLPSYLAALVADAQPTTSTISVQSVDLSGEPVTGLWTTIASGGVIVESGYTPLTFTGTTGTQYTVTVSNYGSYTFNHWQNGSTSPILRFHTDRADDL